MELAGPAAVSAERSPSDTEPARQASPQSTAELQDITKRESGGSIQTLPRSAPPLPGAYTIVVATRQPDAGTARGTQSGSLITAMHFDELTFHARCARNIACRLEPRIKNPPAAVIRVYVDDPAGRRPRGNGAANGPLGHTHVLTPRDAPVPRSVSPFRRNERAPRMLHSMTGCRRTQCNATAPTRRCERPRLEQVSLERIPDMGISKVG